MGAGAAQSAGDGHRRQGRGEHESAGAGVLGEQKGQSACQCVRAVRGSLLHPAAVRCEGRRSRRDQSLSFVVLVVQFARPDFELRRRAAVVVDQRPGGGLEQLARPRIRNPIRPADPGIRSDLKCETLQ